VDSHTVSLPGRGYIRGVIDDFLRRLLPHAPRALGRPLIDHAAPRRAL